MRHSFLHSISVYILRLANVRWVRLLAKASRWSWLAASAFVALGSYAHAQSIQVSPNPALVSQKLVVRVQGLKPGQIIVLRAFLEDKNGRRWQSYAGFAADSGGNVDVTHQSPVNGTYHGIFSMGLIESMQLVLPDYDRARFEYDWSKPLVTKFVAESAGKTLAETLVTRTFVAADVTTQEVSSQGLVATLFLPPGQGPFPAIMALGGSEGGNSAADVCALLSSHGYVCLSLAYFGSGGLPPELQEIPLEYFEKGLEFLVGQNLVQRERIGILGTSKGAEAALLVASHNRLVHAVVAYAPSGFVWSCLCSVDGKSSWSSGAASIPFVPFEEDPSNAPPAGFPMQIGANYEYSLRNQTATRKAAIPVEHINGPVLLISGMDDHLWPSFQLGTLIMHRLKVHHHKFDDVYLTYQNAGHLIGKAYLPVGSTSVAGGRVDTGGTLMGDAEAQEDSWPKVLSFLSRALARPTQKPSSSR